MKSTLAIAMLLAAFSASAQRPLDVTSCRRAVPELAGWIAHLQTLRADLGRPFMAPHEYDQEIAYATSCESYAREVRERIVSLEAQRGDVATPQRDSGATPRPPRPQIGYEAPRARDGVAAAPGGVLIVTDETDPRAANRVARSLQEVAPFSCLRVPVAIHRVSRDELGCRPHGDGRARIVLCSAEASARALAWRGQAGARHVIIVTRHDVAGGNGGHPPVVTDSIILGGGPLAGLHELMHTMGFQDTYREGERLAEGDIMACTGPRCYVLEQDYDRVAAAFGRSLPYNCR